MGPTLSQTVCEDQSGVTDWVKGRGALMKSHTLGSLNRMDAGRQDQWRLNYTTTQRNMDDFYKEVKQKKPDTRKSTYSTYNSTNIE